MKNERRLLAMLAGIFLFAWVNGCTGSSRKVSSCDDCNQGTSFLQNEYCVVGETTQLYCANPCGGQIDCELDHWCVPLLDQGTPYAQSGVLRWVCMPRRFYDDFDGTVWRSTYDCRQGGSNECPLGMTCLQDTWDPSIFFCADPCTFDQDCLTDCCFETPNSGSYCAPWGYCN